MINSELIPISFMLGGSKISTEFVKNEIGTTFGQINRTTGKISLATSFGGEECSSDSMELTFYHELVHGILDTMGKQSLSSDEEFVEGFANLLHQYEKTKTYGK